MLKNPHHQPFMAMHHFQPADSGGIHDTLENKHTIPTLSGLENPVCEIENIQDIPPTNTLG